MGDTPAIGENRDFKSKNLFGEIWKYKLIYLLLLPGALYYAIFKFVPMWGVLIAFENYSPYSGVWGSQWVGLQNFITFFNNSVFLRLVTNSLILSLINIVFYFPIPIVLALLLNEIQISVFKKVVQTVVYIPHFISWIVVASITFMLLGQTDGAITNLIHSITGIRIDFLGNYHYFRGIITIQSIWKDCGWGTVLFLAAIAGIDPQLYEAAAIDGAGRFRQMMHVTLPALKSTIIILLIMRMGGFLDNGFDQIFNMQNPLNHNVSDVFDTYVYTLGITNGQLSYSAAIGVFKSIVGLILIMTSNFFARKFSDTSFF